MITKTAQVDFLIDRAAFLLCVILSFSLLLLLPAELLQIRAQDRKPGLQILRLRELPLIVAHAVLAWNEDDIGRINLRHILRIVSRAAGHNPVGKTELAAKLLTCGADIKGK